MKLRSLLIASVAAAGLSTGAYAAGLGVLWAPDTTGDYDAPTIELDSVFGGEWLDDLDLPVMAQGGGDMFDEGWHGVSPSYLHEYEIHYLVSKPSDWGDEVFFVEIMNAPGGTGGFKIPSRIDVADIHYTAQHWMVTGPGALPPDPSIEGTCRIVEPIQDCGLQVGATS